MKKYRITLNEKQMHVLKDVCELRFRIDLCQDYELSEILATMNDLDLNPDNPNHKTIFDSYIDRREHLRAVIECLFEIANPRAFRFSNLRKRDKDSLIAEDIWQCIRYCLWNNREDKDKIGYTVDSRTPLQVGSEPLAEVEVIEE